MQNTNLMAAFAVAPISGSVPRDGAPAGTNQGGDSSNTQPPDANKQQQNFDPTQFVSKKDFDSIAAALRRQTESLTAITSRKSTADELVDLGFLEKGDDGSYKPKSAAPPPKQKEGEIDENHPVAKQLKALQTQLAAERSEKEKQTAALAEAERNRAVIAALEKSGAVNPSMDFVHIAGKAVKVDDGYFVKGKDQFGGEVDIPLEQYATDFLKGRPELAKASTQTGSGTPAGTRSSNSGGARTIPRSQLTDVTWYMANRDKFASGEFIAGE